MDSFRYVGATATDLEGGRPIEPGEFTGPIDVDPLVVSQDPETGEEVSRPNKNYQLLEDGQLLLIEPSESEADIKAREKKEREEEAATKKAEQEREGESS